MPRPVDNQSRLFEMTPVTGGAESGLFPETKGCGESERFETVLDEIGSCGVFQKLLCILINLSDATCAFGLTIMIVAGATPSWQCGVNGNATYNAVPNATNISSQYCPTDGSLCSNLTFDDEFTSIISEWKLLCGKSWASGIITSLQMAGVAVGAAIAGQLGDIIGRKKALFAVYSVLILANFFSSFSTSVEMFTAFRFFVGVGVGAVFVSNLVLPLEYVGKDYRSFSNFFPGFALGLMVVSFMAYYLRDWRHLTIAASLAGVPFFALWWFVPESVRWLLTRGRYEDAKNIIKRIARINGRPKPNQSTFEQLESLVEHEIEEVGTGKKYTVIDLLRSWPHLKMTLLLGTIWFACSHVYYGLTFGVKNLPGDRYINMLLNAAIDVPAFLGLPLSYKIGRRYAVGALFVVALIGTLTIPIMDWAGYQDPTAVTAISLVAKLGLNGSWLVMMLATAEHYPTVIRNIGVGTCSTVGRVGSIISPLVIELHEYSISVPYVIFSLLILASLLCVYLLGETRYTNLEDFMVTTSINNDSKKQEA